MRLRLERDEGTTSTSSLSAISKLIEVWFAVDSSIASTLSVSDWEWACDRRFDVDDLEGLVRSEVEAFCFRELLDFERLAAAFFLDLLR